MDFSSAAFEYGSTIPKKYTADGENVSPPLLIRNVPENAKSLVLIVDDPDAPVGRFVHWVVWNIPAKSTELSEGEEVGIEGKNDFRVTHWRGPAPPKGPSHRYFFRLYALDLLLKLSPGATVGEVEGAIEGHILAEAEWMGRYGR